MESTGLSADKFVDRVLKDATTLRDNGTIITSRQMSTVLVMGMLEPEFHTIKVQLQREDQDDFESIAAQFLEYVVENGHDDLCRKTKAGRKSDESTLL